MNSSEPPETEQEAAALRAYVPEHLLIQLDQALKDGVNESKKLSSEFYRARQEIEAIKLRMAEYRGQIKRLEKVKEKYFSANFFAVADDLRGKLWALAREERAKALERGEAPKFETKEACAARVEAVKKEHDHITAIQKAQQ